MWKTRLLWLGGLLLLAVTQAAENVTDLYYLPYFSLVLNVEKHESSLIIFQDRLDELVNQHLDVFFRQKIKETTLQHGFIREVMLSSAYVWKELSSSTSIDSPNSYEVRAHFDSHLEVAYFETTADGEDSRISDSIMNLFLIEAFQGDQYWTLVHAFLDDDILKTVNGMKVTVQADGYIQYNGQDPTTMEKAQKTGEWTPTMFVGVVFAAISLVSMIVMWSYLCCCARNSVWVRYARRRRRNLKDKPDSSTDDSHSTSSQHPGDDELEGQWLDAWAMSVTSIPLRVPAKPRKLKKTSPAMRRPAHNHSSYLNAITEADDDSSTVCSTDTHKSKSGITSQSEHSSRTKCSKRARIEELEATELNEGKFSMQECDEESESNDDDSHMDASL